MSDTDERARDEYARDESAHEEPAASATRGEAETDVASTAETDVGAVAPASGVGSDAETEGRTVIGTGAGTLGDDDTASAELPSGVVAEQPRTRWAAIVWGSVFAVAAGLGILTLARPDGYADLVDAAFEITLPVIVATAVAAVGAVVLVLGVAGMLRRAQTRVARRRS